MKKQLAWISFIFIITGCVAPKIGKMHTMNKVKNATTGEISIIRNYNFIGSGVRLYPTVDNNKIVGLYSNEYTHFYLKEGTYNFGLMFPDIVSGKWIQENTLKKKIKAHKHYYFLISPALLWGMEIEELKKEDAEKRIRSSKLIQTGTLSKDAGFIIQAMQPISHFLELEEDDKNIRDIIKEQK